MSTKFEKSQVTALKLSASIGRKLQIDLGYKLSESYRRGMTREQIINYFDIKGLYHASGNVAGKAIYFAITGYNGNLGGETYEGLIGMDELSSLRKQHEIDNGIKIFRDSKGIHAMTTIERRKLSQKTIGNLSKQQRKEIVRLATISRGQIPWEDEEIAELIKCLGDKSYKKGNLSDNVAIARRLNEVFYRNRTVRDRLSVYRAIYRNNLSSKI